MVDNLNLKRRLSINFRDMDYDISVDVGQRVVIDYSESFNGDKVVLINAFDTNVDE